MASIETLEIKLDNIRKMFEEHQKRNDEQFSALEKYLILKIDSDRCTDCSVNPRVIELEKEMKEQINWKNITIGSVLILGFIAPYIIPKIL